MARITLRVELKRLRVTLSVAEFRSFLVDLHDAMHPEWTDEEMLYHPVDGIRYCEGVRKRLGCDLLADHVILRSLVNARKENCRLARRAQEEES